MTDHRKAFKFNAPRADGFHSVSVTRQDSKNAGANLAARLRDPTVAFTDGGAMMACRAADKGGVPPPQAAADKLNGKSLNRDSTTIYSPVAFVAGKTAGERYNVEVKKLVPEKTLKRIQEACEEAKAIAVSGEKPRVAARKVAGLEIPDGSVASSDMSTVVSGLSADGDDIPEVAYHRGRVALGLVTMEDFTSSYKAYHEMMGETKPAATPRSTPRKRKTSGSSSSAPSSSGAKTRRRK